MPHNQFKNILIILNPTAGRREKNKFSKVIALLESAQLSIQVEKTEYEGHGKKIAEHALLKSPSERPDMIIAAGGDGTINEVLNGISPHPIPFGIIPLGTVNVLAKEIGLENSAKTIADCIIRGHHAPCYLGKSNDRYFTLMVSAGLDALSVAHVNRTLKRLIGKTAYGISYLRQVLKSKNILYKVKANGKEYLVSNVIVTNGRLYGGKYICAPDAALGDDQLYLVMAHKGGRLNALIYAFLMLTNRYPKTKSVTIIPVKNVSISCAQPNISLQMDGDDAGVLPAEICLSHTPINLIQPKNSSLV